MNCRFKCGVSLLVGSILRILWYFPPSYSHLKQSCMEKVSCYSEAVSLWAVSGSSQNQSWRDIRRKQLRSGLISGTLNLSISGSVSNYSASASQSTELCHYEPFTVTNTTTNITISLHCHQLTLSGNWKTSSSVAALLASANWLLSRSGPEWMDGHAKHSTHVILHVKHFQLTGLFSFSVMWCRLLHHRIILWWYWLISSVQVFCSPAVALVQRMVKAETQTFCSIVIVGLSWQFVMVLVTVNGS